MKVGEAAAAVALAVLLGAAPTLALPAVPLPSPALPGSVPASPGALPGVPDDVARALANGTLAPGGGLAEALAWLHPAAFADPVGPQPSLVLGRTLPPAALVPLYTARAQGTAQPFGDAVAGWNRLLGARDADLLAADHDLAAVAALPQDVQVALATLLYALTDATALQQQAVAGLAPAQVALLLQAPSLLAQGALDPGAADAQAMVEALAPAVQAVDLSRIHAASQVVASAVTATAPALQAWSQAQQQDAQRRERDGTGPAAIGRFLAAAQAPSASADSVAHLQVLLDALRLAARMQGTDLAEPAAPAAPGGDHPLADALRALGQVPGMPRAGADQLARADALPRSLQVAVAEVLRAQQAVAALQLKLADPAHPASVQPAWLEAQLAAVKALQDATPTLEAWGLVYGHLALLPKTPADAGRSVPLFADAGQAMLRPDGQLATVTRLAARLSGVTGNLPLPPTPAPGSLPADVAALYARLGLVADPAQMEAMERAAAALPAGAAQATARILEAQLRALDRLGALYASLTPADLALLSDVQRSGPAALADRGEVARLRAYYAVADRVAGAYFTAALDLAQAVQASASDLGQAPAHDLPAPPRPWYRRLLDVFSFIPTANAQTVTGEPPVPEALKTCQDIDPAVTDCANDVLFHDPLLRTVVVSGFGSTLYNASTLAAPPLPSPPGVRLSVRPHGQILSLDLGGDDVYRNNAGGATPVLSAGNAGGAYALTDPGAVAVAIDLGGNDRYEAPKDVPEGIQGAGVGGIGLLWDRRGDDSYSAGDQAQGMGAAFVTAKPPRPDVCAQSCTGGAFGIGILLDGEGDDTYRAGAMAQGAGVGQSFDLSVASAGVGGVGILVDASGRDTYTLRHTNGGTVGQGGGSGGLGLLVDGGGNDAYSEGYQGGGASLGIGALVDLDGTDHYTRPGMAGQPVQDGQCYSTVPVPTGNAFASAFGSADALLANPTHPPVPSGFGVVADLGPDGCVYPGFPPTADPGPVLEKGKDSDGDGYPDGIEALVSPFGGGWGGNDGHDYPAGFPAKPDAWDEAVLGPYPPGSQAAPLPYGSPYIVRIPGLFALGDAVPTPYPAAAPYLASIDLGGDDTYANGPGGPLDVGTTAGTAVVPTLALDVGDGKDTYQGGDNSLGSSGVLVDLGGNDTYTSGAHSQGSAAKAVAANAYTVGVLLDAGGDDLYTAGDGSQGAMAMTASPGLVSATALLLDLAGDDRYISPTQGSLRIGSGTAGFSALFVDVAGDDTYQPAGAQGQVAGVASLSTAVFADDAGQDRYIGHAGNPAGPDVSAAYNGRIGLTTPAGTSLGVFWDQDPLHALAGIPGIDPGSPPATLDMPDLGLHVGAATDDVYWGNYALLVDPGGNDTYLNNAGSSLLRGVGGQSCSQTPSTAENGCATVQALKGPCPCRADAGPTQVTPLAAVLLDLAGDDRYGFPDNASSQHSLGNPRSLGAPLPDGTLLAGAGVLTQGAGFLGVGVLGDLAGDDRYVSNGLAQGFGLLGTGILWDAEGDDVRAMDPAVVRAPLRSGEATLWQEEVAGVWRIQARLPLPPAPCPGRSSTTFQAVPDPGSVAPGYDAQDGRLAYSLYDEDAGTWRLWLAHPGVANCAGAPLPFATGARAVPVAASGEGGAPVLSDQLNPRFEGDRNAVLWQDDRSGTFRIYERGLSAKNPDDLSNKAEVALVDGPRSNQTDPDADGSTLVWQDDRTAEGCCGPWGVFAMDRDTRVQVRLSQEGTEAIHPRISRDLVAWLARPDADSPWHVEVKDRHHAAEPSRVLDASYAVDGVATDHLTGDQSGITLSGSTLLFTDRSLGAPRVLRYDWGSDTVSVFRDQAVDAAADPAAASRVAWVSTDARPPASDALEGNPFWEVEQGPLGLPRDSRGARVSDTGHRNEHRDVQGAGWLGSLGLLLDENGQDTYQAAVSSQGASFSTYDPKTVFLADDAVDDPAHKGQAGDRSALAQGGQGLLVDLQGNDLYNAQRFSQGAHVGMVAAPVDRPPGVVGKTPGAAQYTYAEAAQATGLLLDLSGADSYTAQARSQGISELALGVTAVSKGPLVPAPPGTTNPDPQAFLDDSVGLLADLGGADRYRYMEAIQEFVAPPTACALRTLLSSVPVPPPEPAAGLLATLVEPACGVQDTVGGSLTSQPGHNNRVWRQVTRHATNDGSAFPDPTALPDHLVFSPAECLDQFGCPPILHLGGLGVDLGLIDQEETAVGAVLHHFYNVSLSPAAGTRVENDVTLVACPAPNDVGIQPPDLTVKRTEFSVLEGTASSQVATFLGYGQVTQKVCDGGTTPGYTQLWHSNGKDDGNYTVEVRAYLGPSGTGLSLGYIEAAQGLVVDNRATLGVPRVEDALFSPHPFAYGFSDHVAVTFSVSPDPEEGGGHVRATVRDAGGALVRQLRDYTDGAVSGPQEVDWNGRDGAGQTAPAGPYVLEVSALDHLASPDRATTRSFPVDLRSAGPSGGCVSLAAGPCANARTYLNTRNTVALGDGTTTAFLQVGAAGPQAQHPVAHILQRAPGGAWQALPAQSAATAQAQLADGEAREVMVLFEDAAGNLECLPACGQAADGSVEQQSSPADDAGLLAAAAQKEASASAGAPAFTTFLTDLQPPQLYQGDPAIRIDGAPYRLDDTPFLGPGKDPVISIEVIEDSVAGLSDGAGQPAQARIDWRFVDADPFVAVSTPVTLTPRTTSTPGHAVLHGEWRGWPALVQAQAPHAEGQVALEIHVEDTAGNPETGHGLSALFLLDQTAPALTADATEVTYQPPDPLAPLRHQAQAGDTIGVSLLLRDPAVHGFSAPRSALHATLDASALTRQAPGEDKAPVDRLPFRYDASADRYVVGDGSGDGFQFLPVPGLDLSGAQRVSLPVTVLDVAGNALHAVVEVVVGDPDLRPHLDHQDLTDSSAVQTWSLQHPAALRLDYRTEDGAVTGTVASPIGAALDAAGLVHRLEVTGLPPGTRVAYTLTAVDAHGAQQSVKGAFDTLAGLDLQVLSPAPGAALSGIAPIHVLASVASEPGLAPRVVLVLHPVDGGADRTIADADAEGHELTVDLVTDGMKDGNYTLVARLTHGAESAVRTVAGLVVDNTVPQVAILDPAQDAVRAAPPTHLLVRLSDVLSGADPASLRVLRNGTEEVALGSLVASPDGAGAVRVSVPIGALPKGPSTLTVNAADHAGNLGSATLHVLVDPDAPEAALERVLYPDGQTAAQPGQVVRVRIGAHDAVGVLRVAAFSDDLGLNGLLFVRDGEAWVLDLRVPATATDGVHSLFVTLEDRLGNKASLEVPLAVDGTPPAVASARLAPLRMDAAALLAEASQGSNVSALALTPRGGLLHARAPTAAEADLARALFGAANATGRRLLVLEGLEPGQQYRVTVEALDGAHNRAALEVAYTFLPKAVPAVGLDGFQATAARGGVLLEWTPPNPALAPPGSLHYVLMRSAGGGPLARLALTGSASYLDTNVTPGARYDYTVASVNLAGQTGPASQAGITLPAEARIIDASVSPQQGLSRDTTFTFRVRLTGALASRPEAWVTVGDTMYPVTAPPLGDCRDACTLELPLRLLPLDVRHPEIGFHVEVLEAGRVHRFPLHGEQPGPTVYANLEQLRENAPTPAPVAALLLVALLAAAALRRRQA